MQTETMPEHPAWSHGRQDGGEEWACSRADEGGDGEVGGRGENDEVLLSQLVPSQELLLRAVLCRCRLGAFGGK